MVILGYMFLFIAQTLDLELFGGAGATFFQVYDLVSFKETSLT